MLGGPDFGRADTVDLFLAWRTGWGEWEERTWILTARPFSTASLMSNSLSSKRPTTGTHFHRHD